MLSLFPQLLFLAPFAAFAIRIALVILIVLAAWKHVAERDMLLKTLGVFEIAAAIALFVGAWTQGAALLAMLGVALGVAYPKLRAYPISTVALSLVMLATLVVTGPGAFAFDLPL